MNVSPISFKGVVKVTTKDGRESKPQTKYYYTNKKQDGMLLKAAADNLQSIGYKEGVYGSDTYQFHRTLEEVLKTTVPQPDKGFSKFLAIGGDVDDLFHTKKYNTSYNKILYRDLNSFSMNYPTSDVVVDLMNPQERLEAASVTLSEIQDKLADMTGINKDMRISPNCLESTVLPPEKYADIEEIFNRTLFFLDGNIGGADFLDRTPDFKDSSEAYEKLVDNLQTVAGIKSSESFSPVVKYDSSNMELSQKDMNSLRRAIYYLDKITES